ncbi:hypothetical protein KKF84_21910, partial [Myxococcota bacterium]|nr:hypothetical protein [Myxococcota bacterium]
MGPCTSPFSLSGARLLWFVMVAAAALTGCSKSSGHKHDTQKVAPLAVRTWQSRPGNISKKIQYIGTIHSIDENSVLARLPGTLLSLPAQEGEVIKKGQLIAKISTETMDEQGRNLWATYQRAKLDRDYLCHQSNIDQKLGKTGVLTAAAVDVSLHRCNMSKKSTVGILASVSEFYASKAKSLEKSP